MGTSFLVGADLSSLALLLSGELSLPLNVVMPCSMPPGFFRAKSITYSFSVSWLEQLKVSFAVLTSLYLNFLICKMEVRTVLVSVGRK